MYAKLAVAVLNSDTSACDDQQVVTFISEGSHVDGKEARSICAAYMSKTATQGYFEVSDPATADTIRIEIKR